MILPIIAAISRAIEIVIDKTILSRQKVDFKVYLVGAFIPVLIIAVVLGLLFGEVRPAFFEWAYLLAFFGVIGTALGWNAIFYRAIQHEKLSEAEPIIIATPIVTILISAIFMPEERKWGYVILGIIAVLSVIIARSYKHHLKFNRYSLALVGYTLLFGFEALFLKVVLTNCNAFALYPIRVAFLLAILAIIFRPSLKKTTIKNWLSFIGVGIVANAYHILIYLSYDYYGIAVTALFTILQPILVYFASIFLFKEKLDWRSIAAAAIVIACVIYAQFI